MDNFLLLSRIVKGDWRIFSIGRPTDLACYTFFIDFVKNTVIIDRGKYFTQIETNLKGLEDFFEELKIDHKELFGLNA